jgi:hypothetical protein
VCWYSNEKVKETADSFENFEIIYFKLTWYESDFQMNIIILLLPSSHLYFLFLLSGARRQPSRNQELMYGKG